MKTYNITPGKNSNTKSDNKKEIELLEFNMHDGENLKFGSKSKDNLYFKVNVVFKRHCMSRIFCVN